MWLGTCQVPHVVLNNADVLAETVPSSGETSIPALGGSWPIIVAEFPYEVFSKARYGAIPDRVYKMTPTLCKPHHIGYSAKQNVLTQYSVG